MQPFSILGMRVFRPTVQIASGEEIVASFTVEHGAIVISGVRLIESPDGEHRLSFAREGVAGRIVIQGQAARAELLQAAVTVYRTRAGWRAPADQPVAKALPTAGTHT